MLWQSLSQDVYRVSGLKAKLYQQNTWINNFKQVFMYDVSREEDEMKLTLFPSLLLFNLSQNYTPSSSSYSLGY